jgi:hypothetical protein
VIRVRNLLKAAIVGEVVRRVLKAKPTRRKAKATKSPRKRARARSRH